LLSSAMTASDYTQHSHQTTSLYKKIYFNRIWNCDYAPRCIYTVL